MSIKSITIEIKGKDTEFTLEEAKALFYDLNGLFGQSYTTLAPSFPWAINTDEISITGPTYQTNGVG